MPDSAVHNFTDPQQFQAAVRGADMQIFLPRSGPYRAELTRIDLHRLWLQRGYQSLPYVARSILNKNRTIIMFLADEDQPAMRRSGKELTAGEIFLPAVGDENHHAAPMPISWAAMSLADADLAGASLALVGHELMASKSMRLIHPAAHQLARLRRVHQAATGLAATAPDILAHPEVAGALEDALVRSMVACLAHNEGGRTECRGDPARIMHRFEEVLANNPEMPLYLTDICGRLGVSGRTLRLHCQASLGMSPHRYLWLRRMYLVRQALARAYGRGTVTSVALDHGFGELGRFSVMYRELFGESPSATLHSARIH